MKNVLNLELFGEDVRSEFKIYRDIFGLYDAERVFDTFIGTPPRSSWVAEIMGPDEKYQFNRRFLHAKLDYRKSNSKGSRGVFAEFVLESGHYYDVRSQISWGRSERYFCTVLDTGEIVRVPEEEICNAVGAETKEQRRERRNAKKLSGHKCT